MTSSWTGATLAATIDHTLLKAVATEEAVKTLCAEAREYKFATVCVNPCWVTFCVDQLRGSGVGVCTVIGFPLGANATQTKAAEARLAVAQGASEIDMVVNIGWIKSGLWKAVQDDIAAVVQAAGPASVKVIIETCYLTENEKVAACKASSAAGAQFVKTSTGFGTGGATVEDVRLMKKTAGDTLQVKASGGIRTREDAIAMLEAGAARIGASSGIAIIGEIQS